MNEASDEFVAKLVESLEKDFPFWEIETYRVTNAKTKISIWTIGFPIRMTVTEPCTMTFTFKQARIVKKAITVCKNNNLICRLNGGEVV